MATDPKRGEVVKRRPQSAPKNSDAAQIPRIVLDDPAGGEAPGDSNHKHTDRPALAANVPVGNSGNFHVSEEEDSPDQHYVPHRCNSDIGLPTASMPNLSLAMSLGEGAGGDKLGVYCSPRTTRRSVDLDVSRDPARAEYEWLEDKTSSLRVLSASSRVGSAVSLNSVCTAHSVGLLSNDSDDYQDNSLADNSSSCQGDRPGQLRRLMSYPEEEKPANDAAPVSPRTSYSLCNLKAAQAPEGHGQGNYEGHSQGEGRGQLTPEKLCLLPSDLDDTDDKHGGVVGKGGESNKVDSSGSKVHEHKSKSHIVCYSTSNSMREGRIRRWLQDMDNVNQ